MKCKKPMEHRPAMEGVINCKACEQEYIEYLASTVEYDRSGYPYFPWMFSWVEKKQV